MAEPQVFTAADGYRDWPAGTIAVVNYGNYRIQEVWMACGANVGNWFPLGNTFGNRALKDPTVPTYPVWETLVERGPVTVLVAGQAEMWIGGWREGRRELAQQFTNLSEDDPDPSQIPTSEADAERAQGAAECERQGHIDLSPDDACCRCGAYDLPEPTDDEQSDG